MATLSSLKHKIWTTQRKAYTNKMLSYQNHCKKRCVQVMQNPLHFSTSFTQKQRLAQPTKGEETMNGVLGIMYKYKGYTSLTGYIGKDTQRCSKAHINKKLSLFIYIFYSFASRIWFGPLHDQNRTLHILCTVVAHASKKCPKVQKQLPVSRL